MVSPVFKLADLCRLYSTRIKELGVLKTARVHSNQPKNRILGHFPDLTANKEGRDILFAFQEDIGQALKKACEKYYDDEAMYLATAAKIVRKDMLEMQATFTGSLDEDCQQQSVPMIHEGASIKAQSNRSGMTQATLSTGQLLQYNTSNRRLVESTGCHHTKVRETPLPIYVGLTVYGKTRKRHLMDTLFQLGLSISYHRVMDISNALGNRVCEQYSRERCGCPPNLKNGLFTTAAVDNIDHNPSSTTAMDSFHGMGISLFQHPSKDNIGTGRREFCPLDQSTTKRMSELPESYTRVSPLIQKRKDIIVPKINGPVISDRKLIEHELSKENG